MDEFITLNGQKFKIKDGKIGEGVPFERIRRITVSGGKFGEI